jgi:hypothetical protein
LDRADQRIDQGRAQLDSIPRRIRAFRAAHEAALAGDSDGDLATAIHAVREPLDLPPGVKP